MPSPHRTILTAAVPLVMSTSAGIVAQLLGTSLLGHQATAQLAAFAIAGAVLTPVSAAINGGLRGLAPFVAPCRDRPAEVLPILKDARWLSIVLGTAGAGVMLAVPLIARLCGVPEEVTAELGSLPLLFALHVLLSAAGGGANGVLIALGRSRLVLWSSLSRTAVEIVLLLVLVPRLGVQGTGLALVTCTALGLTISNALLLRVPGLGGRSLWPGRPRPREILNMAGVGLPMSATLIVKFVVMGGVTYAAARAGAEEAAAHAILVSLDGFFGMAAFAVGQAVTPEIARAAGPGEVRGLNRAALTIACSCVLATALVVLLLGEVVLGLFTPDATVAALALGLLPLLVAYSVANNAAVVQSAVLMGLKRPVWTLVSAVTGYGLVAAAVGPAAAFRGLAGIWAVLVVGRVLGLAVQSIGFVRPGQVRAPWWP